ncbi:MAG TPA: DegV family protein [Ktedonobacteraceae bacterium]|nr:DegV family protein [Ktedonobacteraceae bacterium]
MVVRIVTDSTADIPLAQARALGISVVPLTVYFGEQAFLDAVELDTATFYQKLQAGPSLPRTSQPPPAKFQEAYARLIEEGADAIISVHVSSKLSGTYQSACNGRDALPEAMKLVPIVVVDSESVSLGFGIPAMMAAEEARQGQSLAEIEARLRDRLARGRILCTPATLEYLHRGGRIGAAKTLLGNMLSVKPILTFKDGIVVPVEQPRTRSKAYARIAQMIQEMGELESIVVIGSDDAVCEQLAQAVRQVYKGDLPMYKLGAVVGTYGGPGIVGVAMIAHP